MSRPHSRRRSRPPKPGVHLIYIMDGQSIPVRLAQGDYGIDVIRPVSQTPTSGTSTKSRSLPGTSNLVRSGRSSIHSPERLSACSGAASRSTTGLVLPLDPTLEHSLDWFGTVPAEAVDKLKKDQMLDPPPSAKEEDLLGVVIAS
jgi:hypothetical protein